VLERGTTVQLIADKTAIGLSLLCALHCLAVPVAVALAPSLIALGLQDEAFHMWLILAVFPLSVVALALGCRAHRNTSVLAIGIVGLTVLCSPLLLGHDMLGEWGERILTLLGSMLIATSHFRNFQLCQSHRAHDCVC
jgi:predicted permease